MLAAAVGLESPTYMNAPEQNSTATRNDSEDIDLSEDIDRQKSLEWIRAGSARMAKIREEMLRKLDEISRREAKQANTGRRSRPDSTRTANPGRVPRSELNASSRQRRREMQRGQAVIRPSY